LWRWRDDDALSEFVQRALGPLIEHDRLRTHELLPTLEALCDSGGRRALAARSLHLNRQTIYRRLERIEGLLGVDLGDAETLLRLGVAVRARRILK
jgi:PucR family transcriptional regulator, purine catabolism regulatory protein